MADQTRKTGLRAALVGFVEGMLLFLILGSLIHYFRKGAAFSGDWPQLLVLALLAAVFCAIGKGIAGSTTGGLFGGVAGLLLGGWLSLYLPQWTLTYTVEEQIPGFGQPFALSGPTLDGKTIDVADLRGKVVLVDFWATWCLPCLHELPHVKSTFEKYHKDGFEIVAVNLDTDRGKLETFLKKQNLPWPQIFFDERAKQGWDNPLVAAHGVRGIPATFLLDQNGTLAATDLRGEDVQREVARLLGNADRAPEKPGFRKRNIPVPMTALLVAVGSALVFAFMGAWIHRSMVRRPEQASS
jgi:thiol-disulfide isomerase/thioredoxin